MKLIFVAVILHVAVAISPDRFVRQTVIPSTGTGTVPAPAPAPAPTVYPAPAPAPATTGTAVGQPGTTATNPAGSTVSYPAGTTITFPAGATVNYPVGSTVTYQNGGAVSYPQTSTVTYPNTATPTTYPAGTVVQYPPGTTVINQPGTTTQFQQPTTVLYGNYGASNPGFVQYPQQTNVGYYGCSSAPISYPSGTPTSAYSYSPNYYGPTGNTTYVRNNDGTTSAVTNVGYTANGYPISKVTNLTTGVTSIVTQTGPNNYIVQNTATGATTNVVG